MLQIKKILFPTDYSAGAEAALEHAARLADWHEAELHVFHVEELFHSEPGNQPDRFHASEEALADKISQTLRRQPRGGEEKAAPASTPPIVQKQVRNVAAPSAILEYADEQDVDLIVMGTHGRRGVRRLMIGSVAEEVVRRASRPVLTVRADANTPRRLVERVLAPVDFSDYTHLTIAHAAALAQTYEARLDLLHVVNAGAFTEIYGIEPIAVPANDVVKGAEERLAEIIRDEVGYEHVVAEVKLGYPATTIVDVAEEHEADLIAIATHGRTGMKRMLMGSVAEKVVRMAPCPVFTVKSFGKSLLSRPGAQIETGSTEDS